MVTLEGTNPERLDESRKLMRPAGIFIVEHLNAKGMTGIARELDKSRKSEFGGVVFAHCSTCRILSAKGK